MDWRRRSDRLRYTCLRTLEGDLQLLNHRLNPTWRHTH